MIDLKKDIYDFEDEYREIYKGKCDNCGKEHEVSTQEDNSPEYYTDIYIKCDCGNSVGFRLPVN